MFKIKTTLEDEAKLKRIYISRTSVSKITDVKQGHKTRRVRLGFAQNSENENQIRFNSRFTLHGLLDSPEWYNPNSILEMGSLKASYFTERESFLLEEFLIANVLTLQRFDYLMKKISWNFKIGVTQYQNTAKEKSLSPLVSLGLGISYLSESWAVALFAQTEQRYSKLFLKNKYHLEAGPRLVLRANLKKFTLVSDLSYLYSITGDLEEGLNQKHDLSFQTSINTATSVSFERVQKVNNLSFYLHYYYQ